MLPVFLISYLIIILSATIFNVSLWDLKNIVCIITSISLFCTFKNINFNNSKIINIISSATLGVYLIHDNNIIRPILWNKWLNIPMHSTLKTFPLFALCSILIVFIACTIIELIRGWIESFICNKIIKKKDLR